MKKEFLLNAGVYIIGDPCYNVEEHNKWAELLGDDYFDKGFGVLEGETVYAFKTLFGDGTYFDVDSFDYGVDSGLIGIMPLSLVKKVASEERVNEILQAEEFISLGRKVEFKSGFKVIFDDENDPTHVFGHICINTNDNDDYYHEYNDKYYEDDYYNEEEDDDEECE